MTATALQLATALSEDDTHDVSAAFLPSPPAPIRRRNRPPQPGSPASTLPSVTALLSTAERNRMVLRMHMAGKTHAEIGQHFGRSVRTIADWYGEAKKDLAKTFRQNTAEDIAAEIEMKFARSFAQWNSILERAQATGNLKLEISALARMDQSQVHRVKALQGIGYFEHVDFKPDMDREEDSVTRSRPYLQYIQASMAHSMAQGTKHEGEFPEPEWRGSNADASQTEPMY